MATNGKKLPVLRVTQWQREWDSVEFNDLDGRRRPEPDFFVASMPAFELRRLADIHRRSAKPGVARSQDRRSQRIHDPTRSDEIAEYVRFGYPLSTLSEKKRATGEFSDLKKPGWLPTAIVVNILGEEDSRQGTSVAPADLVSIDDGATPGPIAELCYPSSWEDKEWKPRALAPIEVIDGQHRLWAFDDQKMIDFELPVVIFNGLDTSWQAYLFYTINIKPKKINMSLAFDLYPLLRNAEWLQRTEEHIVYRETRAQELVEALWSYNESPWRDRINMLGEKGHRGEVTQAAWIRSLVATFVKSYEGRGVRLGGLFGASLGSSKSALAWNRVQQAAVLLELWISLANDIERSSAEWAQELRETEQQREVGDAALVSPQSLLSTDQGVRGVLAVANDLCVTRADELELWSWTTNTAPEEISQAEIGEAISEVRELPLGSYIRAITSRLAEWDWRTSAAPGLTARQQRERARFRGGTGYREIRLELLQHLSTSSDDSVAAAANDILAPIS